MLRISVLGDAFSPLRLGQISKNFLRSRGPSPTAHTPPTNFIGVGRAPKNVSSAEYQGYALVFCGLYPNLYHVISAGSALVFCGLYPNLYRGYPFYISDYRCCSPVTMV